jgi:hypothetical protein
MTLKPFHDEMVEHNIQQEESEMLLFDCNLKAFLAGLVSVGIGTAWEGQNAFAQREGGLATVAFDDFEALHPTMSPFTLPANVFADGTDFTNQIRVGTPRAWTIDNSKMGNPAGSVPGGACNEPAYNGWTAMDVASWTAEQGAQIGRTALGLAARNTALVADPDAYYDFDVPGQPSDAYNGYIYRNYNLTTFNVNTLRISFDYEFAYENNQTGTAEVSFDGGATWQTLLLLQQSGGVPANDTVVRGPVTYNAGTNFTPTSNQMRLRFGCINAGNNWWFAVDNVKVETIEATPFSDLEDFEGLTLVQFGTGAPDPNGPRANPFTTSRFDGTDYTSAIPNWTIDNSGMLGVSLEPGFDGWNAMDVKCWVNEQGSQGRSIFDLGNFNLNACLVADGDAFYDYDENFKGTGPAPANGFNSYISRTYDMSNFDNCDVKITLEYEFRVEDLQRGTIEVSFDGGTSWQMLRELKTDAGAGITNGTTLIDVPSFVAGVNFVPQQTNDMILRIGYLEADNNWWMAVDSIKVEASAISYVKGDANNDGNFDFGDIEAFFLAITDAAAYAAAFPGVNANQVLDFDCDGTASFTDIEIFFREVTGG